MNRRTFFSTKIRCLNRETKTLFDRHYWLDLSRLQEPERSHVE